MKKFVSLALALLMVLALGVTVFAAPSVTNGTQDVTATYEEGTDETVVYSVVLEWSVSEFKYTKGNKTWDASSRDYKSVAGGTWSGTGFAKLTNSSNAAVTMTAAVESDYIEVDGEASATAATAVGTAATTAPTATVNFKVKDAAPAISATTKIATIRVTLA